MQTVKMLLYEVRFLVLYPSHQQWKRAYLYNLSIHLLDTHYWSHHVHTCYWIIKILATHNNLLAIDIDLSLYFCIDLLVRYYYAFVCVYLRWYALWAFPCTATTMKGILGKSVHVQSILGILTVTKSSTSNCFSLMINHFLSSFQKLFSHLAWPIQYVTSRYN